MIFRFSRNTTKPNQGRSPPAEASASLEILPAPRGVPLWPEGCQVAEIPHTQRISPTARVKGKRVTKCLLKLMCKWMKIVITLWHVLHDPDTLLCWEEIRNVLVFHQWIEYEASDFQTHPEIRRFWSRMRWSRLFTMETWFLTNMCLCCAHWYLSYVLMHGITWSSLKTGYNHIYIYIIPNPMVYHHVPLRRFTAELCSLFFNAEKYGRAAAFQWQIFSNPDNLTSQHDMALTASIDMAFSFILCLTSSFQTWWDKVTNIQQCLGHFGTVNSPFTGRRKGRHARCCPLVMLVGSCYS